MEVISVIEVNCIPKIIHYCWFGGRPLPEELKQCIKSWELLYDYKIYEWNESNCTFTDNEFIRRAYEQKQLCFMSDYIRLKVLQDYGGIYFDTDIMIYKRFDPLLELEAFVNFIFDSSIGTAVIGAKPGNTFIKGILDIYHNLKFDPDLPYNSIKREGNDYYIKTFLPNNYIFTYFMLNQYPEFKLNNKHQCFNDVVVFPKEYFEIGTLLNKQYSIHLCTGAWRKDLIAKNKNISRKDRIKKKLMSLPFFNQYIHVIIRKLRYYRINKTLPFYSIGKKQKLS